MVDVPLRNLLPFFVFCFGRTSDVQQDVIFMGDSDDRGRESLSVDTVVGMEACGGEQLLTKISKVI